MKNALPYFLVAVLGLGLVVVLGYAGVKGLEGLAEDGSYDSFAPEVAAEPAFETFPAGEAAIVTDVAPPSSLLAPYPPSLVDYAFDPHRYAPAWLVTERLAVGDEVAQAAMSLLLRVAAPDAEVEVALADLLDVQRTEEHCAWLRREAAAPDLVVGRTHLFLDLGSCEDLESIELLESRPEAIAGWLVAADLEPAVLAPYDAERVLAAFEAMGGVRDVRAGLAYGGAIAGLPPAERTRALAALRQRVEPTFYAWIEPLAAEGRVGPASSLEERVDAVTQRLHVLSARTESRDADRLERALVRCATTADATDEARAVECLRALAARRRALAVAAAHTILGRDIFTADLEELANALAQYSTDAELEADLQTHGLVANEPATGARARVSVRDHLEARRRAACFPEPLSASMLPRLLARFAHLARPILDGAVFDVPDGAPPADGAAFRVAAYLDGVETSLWSSGSSATANLYAMLGLLNRVLHLRGESRRFAALQPGDCVVFGAPEALESLADDDLLFLAPLTYYALDSAP